MRSLLAELITQSACEDERFVVLSGDHGYALFDGIRRVRPKQFINVGIMEQAMVGIAAGLCKQGYTPLVYGLAAFIPMRVLEQIKLDVCFQKLPVIFLGDGAGLVYSTLGASHQCAEDLACLRPLPYLRIYSPADAEELRISFKESRDYLAGPSYIRLGKSDRPIVHETPIDSTNARFVHVGSGRDVVVATGSMTAVALSLARELDISAISVPRIKPFDAGLVSLLAPFARIATLEEHSRYGGLTSAILDLYIDSGVRPPLLSPFTLTEHFMEHCGSYQYALSEHGMADAQLLQRLTAFIAGG